MDTSISRCYTYSGPQAHGAFLLWEVSCNFIGNFLSSWSHGVPGYVLTQGGPW